MTGQSLFEEKQYIGFNRYSILRRLVLAIFCFVAYFYSEERELKGDLFFFLGIAILVISILALFVLHLHTRVFPDHIILDGLWTTRKVKIALDKIVKAETAEYSKYFLNNPVYNLHIKGTIRFYTGGKHAINLTDSDGLVYRIGTQKPEEFLRVIQPLLKKSA